MSDERKARIHFVEAEMMNAGRVRRAHVFLPERGVVTVTGRNTHGKTTFKRNLASLVGGDSEVVEVPRNTDAEAEGAEEYFIRATTSNGIKLERVLTGAASYPKGRWKATDAEGRDLKKHHLSDLLGPRATEPMRFFDLKPDEKREVLLGFAPELKGELERLRNRKAELEEERRPHNSEIQRLGRTPKPEGERPEPIDVSAEFERIGQLQAKERERQDAIRDAEQARRDARKGAEDARVQARRVVESASTQVAGNRADREQAERTVEELERKLAEARKGLARLQDEGRMRDKALETAEAQLAALPSPDDAEAELPDPDEIAASLPDVSEEIAAVHARITQADAVQQALEPWKEWEKAQAALETHRAEASRLTDAIADIDRERRAATQRAQLPFSGIGFTDEGEILLHDLPLGSASGFELSRLALEVTVAADPELGVVLLAGSEIDPESLGELHEFAEAHDIQVIMDMWYSPGLPGEVRMVDGVAHQGSSAEPAEVAS